MDVEMLSAASPPRPRRNKWLCKSRGGGVVAHHLQYHTLCPVPSCFGGGYIVIGSMDSEVLFFWLSLSSAAAEANTPNALDEQEKTCLLQRLECRHFGVQHSAGTILHLDAVVDCDVRTQEQEMVSPPLFLWRMVSCGTDGLVILWKLRLVRDASQKAWALVVVAKTTALEYQDGGVSTVYPTCAYWLNSASEGCRAAEELLCIALTSGQLVFSWLSDSCNGRTQQRSSRVISFSGFDPSFNSCGFRFAWGQNQLLCTSRFSRTVLSYACDDWRTAPIIQRATWESVQPITASAICPSGTVAAWADASGIVVFVDGYLTSQNLTTIQWLGRPFVHLRFLTPLVLAAVGFDGVPVIFMKKGFPIEWAFHVKLDVSIPSAPPHTEDDWVSCSARYAIRSLALVQHSAKDYVMTTANDHGEISVWEVQA